MPFNTRDTDIYRRDARANGSTLSVSEREALLNKYLPDSPEKSARKRNTSDRHLGHKRRIRPYLKSLLHLTLYLFIQFIFGIYIRLRQVSNALIQKFLSIRHYHHRTPAYIKKDTDSLSRLPEHLSVILKYDPRSDQSAALENLIDEVAELAAWSTAAGIPLLSIYENTGVLKSYMSAVQELVHQKLVQYFGPAPLTPSLRVYAPHLPILSPIPAPLPSPDIRPIDESSDFNIKSLEPHETNPSLPTSTPHLDLLLLSATDGRDTLVDLTRTLTEMAQSSKLRPKDITSALINTEINATTTIPADVNNQSDTYISSSTSSKSLKATTSSSANGYSVSQLSPSKFEKTSSEAAQSEPDLLIIFAPCVKLDGYPPWQIRLTEIYCVGDSGGDISGRYGEGRTRVEYQGFLRGLWKYAGAEMRFGR